MLEAYTQEIESLAGFRDLLILDDSGNIELRKSRTKADVTSGVLSGYLASAFAIAENTTLSFSGNSFEVSFDSDGGSVLIMKGDLKYFFLVLDGTPSMGIARLKLRKLVDEYIS
ncbi:MAG TPA: hypothetical protein PKV16_04090 [Caldisericia bacterium]|nr:hypothetical protein [Caldisericia bacterium]HPF48491.1 hypothetical protein [Caldisericia bacterium]HPI83329.1 hypothetical protein [Caldisericia bacterium]HPQ92945.1 hypothetical protein [Caldisericia bacterium]HRV73957.1 hypothetical protein [Caldisericia bacterium]